MNNSLVDFTESEEKDPSVLEKIREREGQIIRIIEAIRDVKKSNGWSTLKSELFDDLLGSLKKDLLSEAKKEDPDPLRLNRLSGQLKWAERYANLDKLEEDYKTQLSGIRKQLHG